MLHNFKHNDLIIQNIILHNLILYNLSFLSLWIDIGTQNNNEKNIATSIAEGAKILQERYFQVCTSTKQSFN